MTLRTFWSTEEDETLRQGYGLSLPKKSIARELHRTVLAIESRARRLKLPMARKFKLWTKCEDGYIAAHYGIQSPEEISAFLGRSCGAVERRTWKLKVDSRGKRQQRAWSEGDDLRLRLAYQKAPLRIIAKQLNRTEQAAYIRAVKLGLGGMPKGKPSKAHYVAILREECEQDSVPLILALSKTRTRNAAYARFRTWARLRKDGYSLPGIGAIAQLDHSSILHGTRALARLQAAA